LDDVQTLFDTSGSSGTFTAAADVALSATNILSVTAGTVNAGGNLARFTHSGGIFGGYLHQIVTISGYTTNTGYNVTAGRIVTAESTYFEVLEVLFGSGESGGVFSADSTELTDTGTSLLEGDTIYVDTDLAIDYDGGSYVVHKMTNSIQINRAFTSTQSGTWSTAGLDHKDPRVIASLNPGFGDSKTIGCVFINDNATSTTTVADDTFTDIDFGTGVAQTASSQRFKILDADNGTQVYTGNEPFSGSVTVDMTLLNGNQATAYDYKVVKSINGGSTFIDLTDLIKGSFNLGNSEHGSSTKTIPIELNKGDQFKVVIASTDSSNRTITIVNFTALAT
jgi:hypothetical protein